MTRPQKAALTTALISSFITTFTGSAMNLSVVNIEETFHTNAALVGWIVTAFTLAVVACSVPMGKIADARGRKRMLLIGVGSFAVISFISGLSVSIWMLIAMRALQGLAGSMIFATNNAILISAFPESERGKMLGIAVCSTYLGLSLGPVLGGILNNAFGWRSIFTVTCAISIAAWISGRGVEDDRKSHPENRENPDVAGNILYMISTLLFLYGLTNLSILKFSWVLVIAGILMLIVFTAVEKRAANPVVKISLFTEDRAFAFSNLAALLNYGATFAVSYLLSIYLQTVKGYPTQIAGLLLIFMPVVQAAFSPLMGHLSDKVAPYKLASAGMGICVIGLAMFAFLGQKTPITAVIFMLCFMGFGFALFSSPNTNAIMACVGPEDYSIANSILATMRTMGQTVSMAIVTIIIGLVMRGQTLNDASPAVMVHTMRLCFLVFVVMCLAGVFFSLARKKDR